MPDKNDILIAMHHQTLDMFLWSQESRVGYWRCDDGIVSVMGFMVNLDRSLRPAGVIEAKWIFPDEPFITYEPSDEDWCRYFGFGYQQNRKVDTGEIVLRRNLPIYAINDDARSPVRWMASSKFVDRVGYDCFTDEHYCRAVRALEFIHNEIDKFLWRKLEDYNRACAR